MATEVLDEAALIAASEWIYLKLYLGKAVNRIDRLVLELDRAIAARPDVYAWFFIRYVDEGGIHLRMRVKHLGAEREVLRTYLIDTCAARLNRLHELPPGNYFPMVATPGFEDQLSLITEAHDDVRVVEAVYEPETDKYGIGPALAVAEDLFFASTEIACAILADEEAGLYSRKSLIPALMAEAYEAFMPKTGARAYWREYCFYWLGGKTPAADDWRETFFGKATQLAEEGISIFSFEQAESSPALRQLDRWRAALVQTAAAYAGLVTEGTPVSGEVLSFNFAHLMNNRLGIASLEEAYIAALLEKQTTLAVA